MLKNKKNFRKLRYMLLFLNLFFVAMIVYSLNFIVIAVYSISISLLLNFVISLILNFSEYKHEI